MTVKANQGNVLGDIVSVRGAVDDVLALTGDVGSSTYTPYIAAKLSIKKVEAERIWADIDATYDGPQSGDSKVWRVATSAGDFIGSIRANRIEGVTNPGVHITGNLNANIEVLESAMHPINVTGSLSSGREVEMPTNIYSGTLTFGSVAGNIIITGDQERSITVNGPMTGAIKIGGSLTQPITVGTTGNPGLIGQIYVNRANGTDTWTGAVKPAGSSSSALATIPYYSNLSSSIGGGAIGLVPFHLHGADCVPAINSYECDGIPKYGPNDDKETIVLRHYGPVFDSLPGNSTIPYVITRQTWVAICDPSCHLPGPEDVSSKFKVTVAPTGKPREVWVYPKTIAEGGEGTFGNYYTYTIALRSTVSGLTDLRSDGTGLSTAPNIAGYPYTVTILCYDLDMSGAVDPGDISAWIDQPVDMDQDTYADAVDLGLVIDAVQNAP